MIRLMGRDLTLYLKFLKYEAGFFFMLGLISFALLIPLYYSGSDATKYVQLLQTNQNTTTILAGNDTEIVIANNTNENRLNVTELYGLTERDEGYNLIMITILNI